jgi:predicted TIM-barrel fold metal-dependent hydrolase
VTDGLALFDVNCRLGRLPWGEIEGGSIDALLARMDRFGVARALVSHTLSWRHDPVVGNRCVVRDLGQQNHDGRLRACWVALPDSCAEISPPETFVRDAIGNGVGAVRVYPADHGFDLDGPDFAGYAEACAGAGLPLVVDLAETTWAALDAVARDHPDLAVIGCEVGYRVLRRAAGVLERRPNVYLDLSDLSTHEGLEWLCARFGPDRLVFGTGAPRRDAAEAVTRLLWSDLDDAAVARIGHQNLDALLAGIAA